MGILLDTAILTPKKRGVGEGFCMILRQDFMNFGWIFPATARSPCPRPAWLSCVSPRLISSWPWLLRLSLSTWQGTYKQIQQWVWSHTWWVPTPEHPRTTVPRRADNPTKITTGFGFFPPMKASTGKWSTNVISLHMGDVQLLQVGLINPISTSQGSSKVPTIDVSSQECTP